MHRSLPGAAALRVAFGWGTLINIAIATLTAIFFEAAVVALRKRPIGFYLGDYSAIVTAVLLGIALPPYAPWWVIATGIFFAVVIAKHLYGGMGHNLFNPAMVGYVVLLISFPVEMTRWVAPLELLGDGTHVPGLIDALKISLGILSNNSIDAITMATPLDLVRQNNSLLLNDLHQQYAQFGRWSGIGWEWVNIGFLLGGIFLLVRKIFTWHAPVCMLLGLLLMSALFYDGGSSQSAGSPLFHLFSGATMLGAWFIVTDPVSSATSVRGRMIYGFFIGVLLYVIRKWGNFPDAIAFAVLLMNVAAPLIDHYTQPVSYGHRKNRRDAP